jgi:hypothetical protein
VRRAENAGENPVHAQNWETAEELELIHTLLCNY